MGFPSRYKTKKKKKKRSRGPTEETKSTAAQLIVLYELHDKVLLSFKLRLRDKEE